MPYSRHPSEVDNFRSGNGIRERRNLRDIDPNQRAQHLFVAHAISYVAVNTGLAYLNLKNNPEKIWFPWALAGWGAGLGLHAYEVFVSGRAAERVERRLERRQDRIDSRQERHQARAEAREEKREERAETREARRES